MLLVPNSASKIDMQSSGGNHQFASDNTAGICPEVLAALEEANHAAAESYGTDQWTSRVRGLVRDLFETDCDAYLVFNGTAANALALAQLCQPFHSVVCHDHAHIQTDECGAPEFFTRGSKLLLVRGDAGKIDINEVDAVIARQPDVHAHKPRVISITQATEFGTVYNRDEIGAIAGLARKREMFLHMDGARFANAVASLGLKPKEITWQAGVDVLCFGGTKNGTQVGDAVVFFNRALADEFDYRCKQAGQLCSKMRFLSAPWVGMLQDGAWLRHATRANAMARRLHDQLKVIPEIKILFPTQANAVFADLPPYVIHALRKQGWKFYTFIGQGGCRLMCAWDTTEADVDRFVADLKRLLVEAPRNINVEAAADHRKLH